MLSEVAGVPARRARRCARAARMLQEALRLPGGMKGTGVGSKEVRVVLAARPETAERSPPPRGRRHLNASAWAKPSACVNEKSKLRSSARGLHKHDYIRIT